MSRVINFNAGPAALPLPALVRAKEELLEFAGSGMSVMEHSHRGRDYEAVHEEAIALVRELLALPKAYAVLFLQGGATMQFATVALNFLKRGRAGNYVVTGVWGEKAYAEAEVVARLLGERVRLAASTKSEVGGYTRVPRADEIHVDGDASYVHFTSNETIHGVEYAAEPGENYPNFGSAPVICDMSSDILSKPIAEAELRKFSLIYAGAQKNMGPSGVTVIVADEAFVKEGRKDIPAIFQYRTFLENNSLYNTPPTFGIYLLRNVLSWIKEEGGLVGMEARNRAKSRLIYDAIDAYPAFYKAPVEKPNRSHMNIVFRLPSEALESDFLLETKRAGMVGLKGHRSVGGIRVSLYNAVSVRDAEQLADVMRAFAQARA